MQQMGYNLNYIMREYTTVKVKLHNMKAYWKWKYSSTYSKVMCPVCRLQTGHITFSSTPYRQPENQSTKYHRQRPPV